MTIWGCSGNSLIEFKTIRFCEERRLFMAGGRSESCVRAAITIKTLLTMDGFQLCQLLKLSLWITISESFGPKLQYKGASISN